MNELDEKIKELIGMLVKEGYTPHQISSAMLNELYEMMVKDMGFVRSIATMNQVMQQMINQGPGMEMRLHQGMRMI